MAQVIKASAIELSNLKFSDPRKVGNNGVQVVYVNYGGWYELSICSTSSSRSQMGSLPIMLILMKVRVSLLWNLLSPMWVLMNKSHLSMIK